MKKPTFQSQFSLFISLLLLLGVLFGQHYFVLAQSGSSKELDITSTAVNYQDGHIMPKTNIVEFENKISRVKRVWSAQPEVEKCTPEKVVERNNCMKGLLPQVNFGIPSTRHETETACRSFSMAMKCMGKWASICLNETAANSYNSYISPAAETYAVICKDKQSRAKFYRHGDCFRKITPGFDACVDEMGAKLNTLREDKHAMQICCHQRNFLKCVSQVLIQNQCSVASSQATMETAERTIQFRPDQIHRKNGTKGVCIRMTNDQCTELLLVAEKRKMKLLLSSACSKNEVVYSFVSFIIGIAAMFSMIFFEMVV